MNKNSATARVQNRFGSPLQVCFVGLKQSSSEGRERNEVIFDAFLKVSSSILNRPTGSEVLFQKDFSKIGQISNEREVLKARARQKLKPHSILCANGAE